MNISVDTVIYFYIFICALLLVYNIFYILRSESRKKRQRKYKLGWLKAIKVQWGRLERGKSVSASHCRRMKKKLGKVERLMDYNEAILIGMETYSDERVQRYLDECHLAFRILALEYAKKPAMERAFFAYLMSMYHPNREHNTQLITILMTYFDDSTVFCRENILQAFYAFGNAEAVERAFALMNDRRWYHDSHLLYDGLIHFSGDKKALARSLWNRCLTWEDNFQVAVVQFAASVSGEFAEEFYKAVQDEKVPMETRFALLRYFQHHIYAPVKGILLNLLEEEEKDRFAIVAANVLVQYPGEDTRLALLKALHSRNWYVRRNAAASLAELGAGKEEVNTLYEDGDTYAAEMLTYMLEESRLNSTSRTGKR